MKIEALTVGPFEVETYLVTVDGLLIIDPGADPESISQAVRRIGKPVEAYLLTHGHIDHLSALAELLAVFPAPVYLHPADAAWAFSASNQLPPFYPPPAGRPPEPRAVHDAMQVNFGTTTMTVIETPGHTPGSVCYYFPSEQTLFSGDSLFQGSVGRTDLDGGDSRRLQASLQIMAGLPPSTVVYPGHGPATTMARELQFNPFMQRYGQ